VIELKNISKTFGKGDGAVRALCGVDLTIEDGTFIAIVGKSGSGKSTMMNIIGALDKPTEGEVVANGMVLSKLGDDKLAEYRNKHIGYIFQSFYLEPTFTVLENVCMPLTISGMKKSEREALAKKAIEQLGLSDKTHKTANELSGGQKQRVSIARAIVHNPDIVLADEPTGNLDSQNGAEVIKLLQGIAATGKTVVLVTHNIDDAYKTDIMVELKDGKIQKITRNSAQARQKALEDYNDYDEAGNLKSKRGTAQRGGDAL
jgi:ABC-type lipoprotein export system ATPase subunit